MGYPPIAARSTGPPDARRHGAACSRSETPPPMHLATIAARYAAQRMLSHAATYQLDRTARSLGEATGVAEAIHLTSDVVAAWVDHERTRLAPHTLRVRLARLQQLWRWAASQGLSSPYEPMPGIRAPRVIIRATPPEDVRRLVAHCQTLPGTLRRRDVPRRLFWPAYAAAVYETALRTSDVLQLRWQPTGRWSLIQKKTGNPVTVTVWPETLRLIEQLAEVSPTLLDVGWRREWYCRGLRRIAERIGIRVTPQQLRRSSISEVERQRPGAGHRHAGHTTDGTTQRWYFDHEYIYGDVRGPRATK